MALLAAGAPAYKKGAASPHGDVSVAQASGTLECNAGAVVIRSGGQETWMRRALELAARGEGETNPNPMVGCVIVRDGRVVGEGWHQRAGAPHAEVIALRQAGRQAQGAALYVNLEPCAHGGRTPPCIELVRQSGIAEVVAAIGDPNPLVNGRGFARLKAVGIRVTRGVLADEALLLNERFLTAARKQRPFLLLKAGLTLDGRIATAAGESKWITSPAQRRAARRLRRLFDGVAVGIGTVLADDPLLLPVPRVRRPFVRVVFDSRLRLPLRSQLVRTARTAPVWVLTVSGDAGRRRRLEAAGVTVIRQPRRARRVALPWAIEALWKHGIWSLVVEGGSTLLGAFLAARLVDQVALFRAPLLLGGRGSLSAFGGPDPARLTDGLRLSPISPLLGRGRRAALRPAVMAVGVPDVAAPEIWYPVERG